MPGLGASSHPFGLAPSDVKIAPRRLKSQRGGRSIGGGIGIMIGAPVFYGLFSFVFGLVYALILNLVLSWAGGLELEIE